MGASARERARSRAAERPARVLVIEDEEAIRQGLCDVLVYHGHEAEPTDRGDIGLDRALSGEHDLVLLDVMLPGVDGFDICRRVRAAHPELPILMLTARGSEEDVLQGFRCGSDDYVTKPFSVAQLVARIEALLRRSRNGRGAAPDAADDFRFGPWLVEVGELRASCDGAAVALSRREVDILTLFSREAGRIVGRRMLLREIWGYPDPDRVETRSVDMQLVRLRRKLGGASIETVRGEGYRYRG